VNVVSSTRPMPYCYFDWPYHRLTHRLQMALPWRGLFALHLLHVESVAWISERKDVLSTFFLVCCRCWSMSGIRQSTVGYVWVFIIFAPFSLAVDAGDAAIRDAAAGFLVSATRVRRTPLAHLLSPAIRLLIDAGKMALVSPRRCFQRH